MSILANIAFFFFTLGVAIIFHELGHFFVGRWCGVKVQRFSVGFGKPLFTIKRGDTEYCLAPIPMGGYVKFAGDTVEEELEGKPWEFLSASPWRRIAIVVAGPLMNIILAFLLYYLVFFFAGEKFIQTTTIGSVLPDFPAAMAGLQPGDKILEINGQSVGGEDGRWEKVEHAIDQSRTSILHMEILRPGAVGANGGEGDPLSFTVPLRPVAEDNVPAIVWTAIGNSPAHLVGMTHGDTILSVSGVPVSNWNELTREVGSKYRLSVVDGATQAAPIPFPIQWRTEGGVEKTATITPDVTVQENRGGKILITRTGLEPSNDNSIGSASPTVKLPENPSQESLPAGISNGDLLVEANGRPVRRWQDVFDAIDGYYILLGGSNFPGVPVTVRWQKAGGEIQSGSLTVQTRIVNASAGPAAYRASIGILRPYSGFESAEQRGIYALGIAPQRPLKLDNVTWFSSAQKAGLKKGDIILAVDDKPVDRLDELVGRVMGQFTINAEGQAEPKPVALTWRRAKDGTLVTKSLQPDVEKSFISPDALQKGRMQYFAQIGVRTATDREKHGIFGTALVAVNRLGRDCQFLYITIKNMITGAWSVKALAGPIGIFTLSGQQGAQGFEEFLIFVAMLSVNLALVNILPIPILDGGHLAIYTLEIIRKRQLSRNQIEWAHRIAFFFVLLPLIVAVFYIDLERMGLFEYIGRTVKRILP